MTPASRAAALLETLRARRPLVHVIANLVTMQAVASATRAVGALPVMALAVEEAGEVACGADALVLSLGTPTRDRLAAMRVAGREAARRSVPVVFDPVGAGATRYRRAAAAALLDELPIAVIRANRGEAAALLGRPPRLRGVETVAPEQLDGAALAMALAQARGTVAAITGAHDHIAAAGKLLVVENGHRWLEATSGSGCMATAVAAAFCAVGTDYALAAAAALACFGLAAERAAARAGGPGTLVPALLDALFHLSPADLDAGARLKEA
ncbi:MAG: hydroxyethylthiazole kinase [Armatimonadota bacterium]|nr:hydroxyethylthiazole kinase [Armatimonadota bacterium]MDR7421899.1 hydroxyethylthiazole kinase [Armatimonadota bacterium]MDR7452858.1 hydroxyethylthiazole kinase [Armatimonadota bacterium]MDR7456170.1 hydroxyethylthiazole kinase [Armatimonadota bacterium]MDR7496404.1 hydroxyethylthiazole kinase [Armatimonadota bacterium]